MKNYLIIGINLKALNSAKTLNTKTDNVNIIWPYILNFHSFHNNKIIIAISMNSK